VRWWSGDRHMTIFLGVAEFLGDYRMKLTDADREWVQAFKRELSDRFPGAVREMFLYGSKARGDSGPESDLDVLLILEEGSSDCKLEIRRAGYDLDPEAIVAPSIFAYTTREWEQRKVSRSPLRDSVVREGVSLL
jgi:predicted nucleotidyltransferase